MPGSSPLRLLCLPLDDGTSGSLHKSYAIGDGCNCHPRKSSISGSLTGGLEGAFASGYKIGRLAAEAL